MPKTLITILNVISALPIVIYPILLLTSIMVFDAPGSGKSTTAIVTAIIMAGFPLFIGLFIFLSRKFNSVPLAVMACIPMVIMLFFVINSVAKNIAYNKNAKMFTATMSKDFVCNNGKSDKRFITLDKERNQLIMINPDAGITFFAEPVGTIVDGTLHTFFRLESAKELYSTCINDQGKTLLDTYKLVQGEFSPGNFNLDAYRLKDK